MSKTTESYKYIEIRDYIINLISTECMKEGDKLPTEATLCNQFDVSRVTVQNALNGLQKLGKIHRVRGGGSYVGTGCRIDPKPENMQATVFIPYIMSHRNPSTRYLEVIKGIEDALKSQNGYVTVHASNGDPFEEKRIIDNIVKNGINTMIVHSEIDCSFYHEFIQKGCSFVFLDTVPSNVEGNLITSDNFSGGYMATKHLVEKGFKRIAMLSEPHMISSIQNRIRGYRCALNELGLPDSSMYEEYVEFDHCYAINIHQHLRKLLSMHNPPDAIFCINDYTAIQTYEALTDLGVRVPDDIALIGFDNLPLTLSNPVPISTIAQDFYNMGYHAGMLASEISKNHSIEFTHKILPVSLIERASTNFAMQNKNAI